MILAGLDDLGLPIFPELDCSCDMSSDACFSGIRGFLRQCETSHNTVTRESKQLDMAENYPSRLIQIDITPPRIVDSLNSSFAGIFATLSYVWGQDQNYVLLESTLDTMCSSLDMDVLPATIHDAILAARRLDFNYLWVDAL
jgi:hypothetical protein